MVGWYREGYRWKWKLQLFLYFAYSALVISWFPIWFPVIIRCHQQLNQCTNLNIKLTRLHFAIMLLSTIAISLPDPVSSVPLINILPHTLALERVLGERMRCKFYLLLLYCLFSGNRSDNKGVLHLKDTSLWNWKLTFAVSINCKAFELEDCSCGRASLMSFKYSVAYLATLQFIQKCACLS